jgi:hypothetical protein
MDFKYVWTLQETQKDFIQPLVEIVPEHIAYVTCYAIAVPILSRVWGSQGMKELTTSGNSESMVGFLYRQFKLLYNIILAVFSAWACYHAWSRFFEVEKMYDERCDAFYDSDNYALAFKLFVWSKYVEFFDTLFLVMDGRTVSWLHYLHHIGAAVDMAGLMVTKAEYGFWFIGLNSFVHTVMYTYYASSTIFAGSPAAKKILRAFKPFITSGQIVQFLTGFYFHYFYKNLECVASNPHLVCMYYYQWVYVGMVLLMFLNFFMKSYCCAKKKKVV